MAGIDTQTPIREKQRIRFLDYMPPIVAFFAAVAAVIGSPKWAPDGSGLSKITLFGWSVPLPNANRPSRCCNAAG